jgi:cell pole-organizing protein PopZ
MGDMTKEPSMEEILSSIKRIIAEEGEEAVQQAAPLRRSRGEAKAAQAAAAAPVEPATDEILELTDEIAEDPMPAPKAASRAGSPVDRTATPVDATESILSVESEVAARHSLSTLSSMLVTPAAGQDNTLDGLVRAMLKPMLKEWLDAHLPTLVEEMVAKEIARIAGGR